MFAARPFLLGLGPGLLIAAVLLANNLTDLPGDRAAGVRTLAARIGFRAARRLYRCLLLAGPLALVVLWVSGTWSPWVLLGVLALPALARCGVTAARARGEGDPVLEPLTPLTAQAHMAFCLLLVIGVGLDRI